MKKLATLYVNMHITILVPCVLLNTLGVFACLLVGVCKNEGYPDVSIHLNTMSVCPCQHRNTCICGGHAGFVCVGITVLWRLTLPIAGAVCVHASFPDMISVDSFAIY